MRPSNETVLNAVTGTTNSAAIDCASAVQISLIGVGTATLAGDVKLQVSNDAPPAGGLVAFTPSTWVDLASATASLSAAGTTIIPKTDVCYRWMRAVFTASGGTGTYTAKIKINAV